MRKTTGVIVVALLVLTGCEKETVFRIGEESKACMLSSGRNGSSSSLPVNIENKVLDDGRVQCTITTVHPLSKAK